MKHCIWYYLWWGLMPKWVHKISLRCAMNKIKRQRLKEQVAKIDKLIESSIRDY